MKLLEILLLFIMAFLPPVLYAIWIRNTEKYNREKWKPIIFCFIWGATIAIVASIILEVVLGSIVVSVNSSIYLIISAVLIAPFAEEFTKPLILGFKTVKKELDELEDGLIYGAVAGLGFSATENLFYGYNAFISEGLLFFFVLVSIRSFTGCLLHASATAWTGYGYGKKIMKHTPIGSVIPYFLLAFLVHAFYNFIPIYGFITGFSIAVFVALMFVALTIYVVRNKIRKLDKLSEENVL
ncbi:MAG: hypothetical protein DRN24_05280 [Thermoplasmata archaeon]|nr:MAG: hypothetical protein DRN24_05280 [Thermoplasmata archaeon]